MSISRRNFLKTVGAGLALAAVPTLTLAAEQRNPNFVVILVDDMGYGDVEPFGSKLNRTPNLNRMLSEGMKLTSFYGAPVCTPSRAQMMTGCYAKRVSLPKVIFAGSAIGLNPDENTVASLLKKSGYTTMCIGKWHLGDQPEFMPTNHGFDHYLGLPYSNDMKPLPLMRDAKIIEPTANQDELEKQYTEEAVKFITTNKDRPFFLYFPHTAVHVPIHPGKEFLGKSKNGKFGDWVEEVDWSVGRVLDTIRELKLESNTFVLFTSDNGPWLQHGKDAGTAAPLRGGKGTCWEGGMREPTIAWWPGKIKAGSSCDAVTSEMDVLPTLVGLAGGKVPTDKKIDGLDIWPILSGKTTKSPREALYYFRETRIEAVRSGQWKLIVQKQIDSLAKGPANPTTELYDLDADISETTNVADKHAEIVQRLKGYIDAMDKDLGIEGGGPGVRKPGKVAKPRKLTKDAREYD